MRIKTFIVFCITILNSLGRIQAQSPNYNEITSCIVTWDNSLNPIEGLDLKDSSATLELLIAYHNDTVRNLISFDERKRITYAKTRLGQLFLVYKGNSIAVKSISFSGSGIFCQDTMIQEYTLNVAGQLISAKTCKQESYTYRYTKQSFGMSVEVIKNDSVVRQHLFLYGKKNKYFQWQIVTDRGVVFKFKRSEIGTEVNLDSYPHVNHVLIELNSENKVEVINNPKTSFMIYDALGNIIGSIMVRRLKSSH